MDRSELRWMLCLSIGFSEGFQLSSRVVLEVSESVSKFRLRRADISLVISGIRFSFGGDLVEGRRRILRFGIDPFHTIRTNLSSRDSIYIMPLS